MNRRLRVAVVGAGAFGGWTALELARRGALVTLIDAWGPANPRASSGGDTRVIRSSYGIRAHYTALAVRARQRWSEFEEAIGQRLFHRTGVLWLFDDSDEAAHFANASATALRDHGDRLQDLTPAEASRRYPQMDLADVALVLFEPDAGYLMARLACELVAHRLRSDGDSYRVAAAPRPVDVDRCRSGALCLTDETALEADVFVFACGPWLGPLFPDIVGRRVLATRQEVYYFGTAAGESDFTDARLPVWIDIGCDRTVPGHRSLAAPARTDSHEAAAVNAEPLTHYGIPAHATRGFKLADDTSGPEIDPTTIDRTASPDGVARTRAFLARRFPGLARAPLVSCEVCQYEATPDAELIVDRHPRADNVWLVGGGSGHGFKLGPAIGEIVASQILDGSPVDSRFALSRFEAARDGGWPSKWT